MNTMNAGTIVGGILGLLLGIIFIVSSVFTGASQVDPPLIILLFLAALGAAIGHFIVEMRRQKKTKK